MTNHQSKDGFPMMNPHDGREFELMNAGRKDVAFFHQNIPTEISQFKAREDFDSIEWESSANVAGIETLSIPCVILYRTSHEKQAMRLQEILTNYVRGFDPNTEREIGQILGYPHDAIEYYITYKMVAH